MTARVPPKARGGSRLGAGRPRTTGTGRLLRLSPDVIDRLAATGRGGTPQDQIAALLDALPAPAPPAAASAPRGPAGHPATRGVLALLQLLTPGGTTVAELCERVDLGRSGGYRMIAAIRAAGIEVLGDPQVGRGAEPTRYRVTIDELRRRR